MKRTLVKKIQFKMRKSDNNDKSKEISPETNIGTITENGAQRSDGRINSQLLGKRTELKGT